MLVKLLTWTFVRLKIDALSHASDVVDDAVRRMCDFYAAC
jgi:hypothetical protein